MRVGIHASLGCEFPQGELKELVDYCKALGIRDVCPTCVSLPGYKEQGYPDPPALREIRRMLGKAGISIPAMIAPVPSEEAVRGDAGVEEEVKRLCRSLRVIGESGTRTALFYPFDRVLFSTGVPGEPSSRRLGSRGRYDEVLRLGPDFEGWQSVVQFFETVVEAAEEADLRLANHVWDAVLMDEILKAVPSHHNGIQYCTGMYIIGGDPYAAVDHWGVKRIYLVHMRNLIKHGEGFNEYEEVSLDEGDIDIAKCVRLLQGIGYDGIIIPEHLRGEGGRDPTPKAVQYLKGLLF
jgi:D-mannonate dehydratase